MHKPQMDPEDSGSDFTEDSDGGLDVGRRELEGFEDEEFDHFDGGIAPRSTIVQNQPFDEAIDVSDEESGSADDDSLMDSHRLQELIVLPKQDFLMEWMRILTGAKTLSQLVKGDLNVRSDEYEDSPSREIEDESPEAASSSEIEDLAKYVEMFEPSPVIVEPELRPFIPDYIPAIGDLDTFVKIPRPDGSTDNLGLTILDEPSLVQTDPTVLELQLRAVSKKSGLRPAAVRSVDDAANSAKGIQAWIDNIDQLHKTKPRATVEYARNMPDIDELMQIWPEEVEAVLTNTELPSADIDLDLIQYSKLLCALLDIPVYERTVESLHVMFTLFAEFKANLHFQNQQI